MARRGEQRCENRHAVRMDIVRGNVTVGISSNISRHGLLITALEEFPLGQELQFELELAPDELLPFSGRVVWRHSSAAGVLVGLSVDSPPPAWEHFVGELEGREGRSETAATGPMRAFPRYPTRLHARYGLHDTDDADGVVVDASPGGIAIEGPLTAAAGTSVFVEVELPGSKPVSLVGQIAWHASLRGQTRLGLQLRSADETFYAYLATLAEPPRPARDDPPSSPPSKPPLTPNDLFRMLETMRGRDPFAMLGLLPTDDVLVIERAYTHATHRLQPERLARDLTEEQRGAAAEIFILLNSAHRTLQDPTCRARLLSTADEPSDAELLDGMEIVVSDSSPATHPPSESLAGAFRRRR